MSAPHDPHSKTRPALPSSPITCLMRVVDCDAAPSRSSERPIRAASTDAHAATVAPPSAVAPIAERPATDWDALTPRGVYARVGRPLFLGALVFAGLPFALFLAAIVAPINAFVFQSPSQVFFGQERVGLRGRVFRIWKFRTMRAASRDSHTSWSSGEDVLRVTRFGRFLRSSHLDELPQVWNVLRGDMDLIGPRPEMVEIESWAREHVPGFEERLVIRPGLTGLAQVTQGYTQNDAAAYAEKLRINREYLRTLSFVGDARVVLRTVAWMARGRGWSSFRRQRATKQT